MKWLRLSKRWLIAGAVALGLGVMVLVGLGVVYPRVGAYMIRHKISGRLETKLGRKVTFGAIDVSLGHAVLRRAAHPPPPAQRQQHDASEATPRPGLGRSSSRG